MKLATIRIDGSTRVARIEGETATVLDEFSDVGALLASDGLMRAGVETGRTLAVDDLDFAPVVVSPGKIVCVGLNYRAHILEMGRPLPDFPVLFAKFSDSLLGAGDEIVLPPESESIDWEGELAVVIGRTVRRASTEDAEQAIAGYTIANDVSMRDWQFRTREWLQGKMWEASTPLGPVLATSDEIPAQSHLVTSVNGNEKQRGDVHDLVHDPVQLVAYISTITTLRPGDVILTGTPGGVGHAREPREYLSDGDTVTVSIDGIGSLINRAVSGARS